MRMSNAIVSFLTQLDFRSLCLQNTCLWPMIWMTLSLEVIDKLNQFYTYGSDIENTFHFHIDSDILNQADTTVTKTLLFSNSKYSNEVNLQISNASIDFILTSKRFNEPLKFLIIKISKRSLSVSFYQYHS